MNEGPRIGDLLHLPTRAEAARVAAVLVVALGFGCLAATLAEAKVYLDINAPSERRMPVAVPLPYPLGGTPPSPEIANEVREVVAGDLDFSGEFRVLDPVLYLENRDHAGITLGNFRFEDWELINAEILVKAGYTLRPDGDVELEYRLFDVFQRREIVAKRWKGRPSQIRRMSHLFSDEVVRQVTGEEGIFSTAILYVVAQGGGKEIYAMDYDGAGARRLTQNGSINLAPAWWPDRLGIVYTSFKSGIPDLYSMALAGQETQLTTGAGVDVGAEFSPDGKRMALMRHVDGNSDIYVTDPQGQRAVRLTQLRGVEASPSWSPDGRRLAFVSDRYGGPQVFVMNSDGSGVRRITFEGKYNTSPVWSPKGDLIAYTTMKEGKFNLALINPDTLEGRVLVGDEGNNEDPSWSPDGSFLAFSSDRTGIYQVYVVDREGRREWRLTSGSGAKSAPAWSPR